MILPIGTVKFYVIDIDTLFLLCLQDMDRMKISYDNIANQVVYPGGSHLVVRCFDHLFILWTALTTITYLTELELR